MRQYNCDADWRNERRKVAGGSCRDNRARISDLAPEPVQTSRSKTERLHTQNDFDQEVALIYATYSELLNRHQLTEADADQLRALAVLKGEVDGRAVRLPWLASVQLLVLDGFFDFTPVQGEILQRLIPQAPDVLVNLNHDERNQETFFHSGNYRPSFQSRPLRKCEAAAN